MIFDNMIYPDNKKKKIKELELELVEVFENYNGAWNEFCKVLNIEDRVPRLKKSIRDSRIEDCLLEIDSATQELDNVIKNANQKLKSEKLLGEIDYTLGSLQSDKVCTIIKYSSLLTGGISGLGIAVVVCQSMMTRYKERSRMLKRADYPNNETAIFFGKKEFKQGNCPTMCQKTTQIEKIFRKEYTVLSREFENQLKGENSVLEKMSFVDVYKRTYGKIDKLENALLKNIEVIINSEEQETVQKVIQKNAKISRECIDALLGTKHCADFIDNVKTEKGIKYYKEIELSSKNAELTKIDVENVAKKVYFKTAIVGIIIVVSIVLILDAITCCIEGFIRSKELKLRLGQMNNIVGELTRTMGSETAKLTKLTQSIKDGVVILDDEHMILVDTETSKQTIVTISEIE
ncbi:MAG: hypothetical protein ACRCSG_05185 [Cellulosilyticaceae bacterium]